jgi:FAD/FMN-containing dehydrogenase
MSGLPFESTAPSDLAAAAVDYGNIVHHLPRAVVRPECVEEVVAVMRSCRRRGLRIAARGQGHSTDGQAQVEDGVVVDMSRLRRIEHAGDGVAIAEAGLTWRDLLAACLPRGWAPPVLTGYTGLSIGGTLSMGGIGGASFREGAQVDHVVALDVVTGDGELLTCDEHRTPELFDAVRGGVGQYGIIVRATLRLNATRPRARQIVLGYSSIDRFFADLERLASRQDLDGVYGQVVPAGERWAFVIHTVRFVSGDDDEPRDAKLLEALEHDSVKIAMYDRVAFDTLVDTANSERARVGLGDLPRIWHDAFLPASVTESFVADTLQAIAPRDLGPAGFVLLFPIRNRGASYALRLPAAQRVYLFDVLTSGVRGDDLYVTRGRAAARRTFERARGLGGTLYPIGSARLSPEDWGLQFGAYRQRFIEAKRRFDPGGLLAPGAGVFA